MRSWWLGCCQGKSEGAVGYHGELVVGQAEDPGTCERIAGKRASGVKPIEELLEVGDVFLVEPNEGESGWSSRI